MFVKIYKGISLRGWAYGIFILYMHNLALVLVCPFGSFRLYAVA